MADSIEETLQKLDESIIYFARRFKRGGIEEADLAQFGRIGAWEAGQKLNNPGYMLNAAKYEMWGYIKKQYAKKRKPILDLVRLDHADIEGIHTDKEYVWGAGLHNLIADKKPSGDLTVSNLEKDFLDHFKSLLKSTDIQEYKSKTITEFLKETFGKRYLRNIQRFSEPRKIVREIFKKSIEDIVEIPAESIATEVDNRFFIKNKLWPLLWIFYRGSPAEVKLDLYPNLRPWQFKRVPHGFWDGKVGYQRAVEAIKLFCEDNKIKSAKDCREVEYKDLANYGLGGAMEIFSRSPYLALKSIFPNLEKRDKRYVHGRFPNDQSIKSGLLEYFIEKGIGNIEHQTTEELFNGSIKNIHITDLRKRFSPIISKKFNGSAYSLLAYYFPNKIKPWLISGTHSGWNKGKVNVAAEAIRWLFNSYWRVKQNEIPDYATYSNIHNVGFGSLLTNAPFSGNMYKLIDNAYPGIFSKEQFGRERKRVQI